MDKEKVLVVGARQNSLGEAVAKLLKEGDNFFEVVTAGLNYGGLQPHEDYSLDITSSNSSLALILKEIQPRIIVCTTGINEPFSILKDGFIGNIWNQMEINYCGVMNLLSCCLKIDLDLSQFVAVSSNSAHIPRSESLGYCASKAALSMGIRVAAREVAKNLNSPPSIYCYEFGLLEGTPMTKKLEENYGSNLTRMVELPRGIPLEFAAIHIYNNIRYGAEELNGVCLRIDNGEI